MASLTDEAVSSAQPMLSAPLLEVVDLKTEITLKRAVVHAVDGLSFTVNAGETVGIVGESGCGKSISALSIMRLLPPKAYIARGEVRLQGRDLVTLSDREVRRIRGNEMSMIFQDPMSSLNPTMPIGRQIAETLLIHRDVSKKAAMDRAAEVLDLVGLPSPRERLLDYPHQLSGGLRQRVMIAMALVCDPKLLIADEPTTALDVTIQAQILRLLGRIKHEFHMGIILITHDMGVIAGHADRVVVMYAGQKVESAPTEALFREMRHPYTEALFASIPRLSQDRTKPLYSIPGLPPDLRSPTPGCRFVVRCRFATEQCFASSPPLTGDNPDHRFACYHPREHALAETGQVATAESVSDVDGVDVLSDPLASESGVSVLGVSEPDAGRDGQASLDRESAGLDAVLEFRGVSKEFAVTAGGILQRRIGTLHAVSDVSLEIRRGETFGLVGESGCGKTTLGRIGAALEPPTAGQVLFDGADLGAARGAKLRELRRDIQLMFQDPYASLDPRMRIKEIVSEPLDIAHRGTRSERTQTVRRLLDEVGLPPDAAGRYAHEFSGGQRQRVGLARALALNPKVIVADEPVSALDVSIRSQMLNLMKRVQLAHGLTYMVISHDLSVIRYMADRIGVMYLGKLVEIGTGDQVYLNAAHPYTAGLLETIPEPDPKFARAKAEAEVPIKGELPSPLDPPSGCPFRTRCRFAKDICAEIEPLPRPFGSGHYAACHFPLQTPVNEPAAPARSQPSDC